MRAPRALAALTALAVAAAAPAAAWACATCFGDPDSTMTAGLNRAILFLIACVGLVFAGIGKVIWDMRKRSRGLADPTELRLIRGGKH